MLRSISDPRALFGLALLATLSLGCEDGRCIRHSDCASPLTCLATRCVVPPGDADTGVADTAVVDRPATEDVRDASAGADATVDVVAVDASTADVVSGDLAEDAAMDAAGDVGPDAVAAD